jgi:hypothetical protein
MWVWTFITSARATFIGKGKLLIGNGDDFVPIADVTGITMDASGDPSAEWPTDNDLSITIELEATPEERRNLLVWWLMLDALATANRILR